LLDFAPGFAAGGLFVLVRLALAAARFGAGPGFASRSATRRET
jgi:hypothetical protein